MSNPGITLPSESPVPDRGVKRVENVTHLDQSRGSPSVQRVQNSVFPELGGSIHAARHLLEGHGKGATNTSVLLPMFSNSLGGDEAILDDSDGGENEEGTNEEHILDDSDSEEHILDDSDSEEHILDDSDSEEHILDDSDCEAEVNKEHILDDPDWEVGENILDDSDGKMDDDDEEELLDDSDVECGCIDTSNCVALGPRPAEAIAVLPQSLDVRRRGDSDDTTYEPSPSTSNIGTRAFSHLSLFDTCPSAPVSPVLITEKASVSFRSATLDTGFASRFGQSINRMRSVSCIETQPTHCTVFTVKLVDPTRPNLVESYLCEILCGFVFSKKEAIIASFKVVCEESCVVEEMDMHTDPSTGRVDVPTRKFFGLGANPNVVQFRRNTMPRISVLHHASNTGEFYIRVDTDMIPAAVFSGGVSRVACDVFGMTGTSVRVTWETQSDNALFSAVDIHRMCSRLVTDDISESSNRVSWFLRVCLRVPNHVDLSGALEDLFPREGRERSFDSIVDALEAVTRGVRDELEVEDRGDVEVVSVESRLASDGTTDAAEGVTKEGVGMWSVRLTVKAPAVVYLPPPERVEFVENRAGVDVWMCTFHSPVAAREFAKRYNRLAGEEGLCGAIGDGIVSCDIPESVEGPAIITQHLEVLETVHQHAGFGSVPGVLDAGVFAAELLEMGKSSDAGYVAFHDEVLARLTTAVLSRQSSGARVCVVANMHPSRGMGTVFSSATAQLFGGLASKRNAAQQVGGTGDGVSKTMGTDSGYDGTRFVRVDASLRSAPQQEDAPGLMCLAAMGLACRRGEGGADVDAGVDADEVLVTRFLACVLKCLCGTATKQEAMVVCAAFDEVYNGTGDRVPEDGLSREVMSCARNNCVSLQKSLGLEGGSSEACVAAGCLVEAECAQMGELEGIQGRFPSIKLWDDRTICVRSDMLLSLIHDNQHYAFYPVVSESGKREIHCLSNWYESVFVRDGMMLVWPKPGMGRRDDATRAPSELGPIDVVDRLGRCRGYPLCSNVIVVSAHDVDTNRLPDLCERFCMDVHSSVIACCRRMVKDGLVDEATGGKSMSYAELCGDLAKWKELAKNVTNLAVWVEQVGDRRNVQSVKAHVLHLYQEVFGAGPGTQGYARFVEKVETSLENGQEEFERDVVTPLVQRVNERVKVASAAVNAMRGSKAAVVSGRTPLVLVYMDDRSSLPTVAGMLAVYFTSFHGYKASIPMPAVFSGEEFVYETGIAVAGEVLPVKTQGWKTNTWCAVDNSVTGSLMDVLGWIVQQAAILGWVSPGGASEIAREGMRLWGQEVCVSGGNECVAGGRGSTRTGCTTSHTSVFATALATVRTAVEAKRVATNARVEQVHSLMECYLVMRSGAAIGHKGGRLGCGVGKCFDRYVGSGQVTFSEAAILAHFDSYGVLVGTRKLSCDKLPSTEAGGCDVDDGGGSSSGSGSGSGGGSGGLLVGLDHVVEVIETSFGGNVPSLSQGKITSSMPVASAPVGKWAKLFASGSWQDGELFNVSEAVRPFVDAMGAYLELFTQESPMQIGHVMCPLRRDACVMLPQASADVANVFLWDACQLSSMKGLMPSAPTTAIVVVSRRIIEGVDSPAPAKLGFGIGNTHAVSGGFFEDSRSICRVSVHCMSDAYRWPSSEMVVLPGDRSRSRARWYIDPVIAPSAWLFDATSLMSGLGSLVDAKDDAHASLVVSTASHVAVLRAALGAEGWKPGCYFPKSVRLPWFCDVGVETRRQLLPRTDTHQTAVFGLPRTAIVGGVVCEWTFPAVIPLCMRAQCRDGLVSICGTVRVPVPVFYAVEDHIARVADKEGSVLFVQDLLARVAKVAGFLSGLEFTACVSAIWRKYDGASRSGPMANFCSSTRVVGRCGRGHVQWFWMDVCDTKPQSFVGSKMLSAGEIDEEQTRTVTGRQYISKNILLPLACSVSAVTADRLAEIKTVVGEWMVKHNICVASGANVSLVEIGITGSRMAMKGCELPSVRDLGGLPVVRMSLGLMA